MSVQPNEPATDGALVSLSAVTRRFGEVTAVERLSFRIHRGERVAMLGPNGAGKTTVLGMILGLLRPSKGAVSVLGGAPRAAIANGHVGAMLQQAGLPTGARVTELIDMLRSPCDRPLDRDANLRLGGLEQVAGRRVERLSAGLQQRLRFALALAGAPELLVLDEPTSVMDVAARRALWSRAAEYLTPSRAVLFTTHRLDEAERHADRVLLLSGGRLVADRSPDDLRRRDGGYSAVRFRAPGASLGELQSLPSVERVAIAGESVTLQCVDVERTLRTLLEVVPRIEDLEVDSPRLEDAFLNLTSAEKAE